MILFSSTDRAILFWDICKCCTENLIYYLILGMQAALGNGPLQTTNCYNIVFAGNNNSSILKLRIWLEFTHPAASWSLLLWNETASDTVLLWCWGYQSIPCHCLLHTFNFFSSLILKIVPYPLTIWIYKYFPFTEASWRQIHLDWEIRVFLSILTSKNGN